MFASQRGQAPTMNILSQHWASADNMTEFLTANTTMESLSGIPLICYIPGAWIPHFINDTWKISGTGVDHE
jgi:hypothetical protein